MSGTEEETPVAGSKARASTKGMLIRLPSAIRRPYPVARRPWWSAGIGPTLVESIPRGSRIPWFTSSANGFPDAAPATIPARVKPRFEYFHLVSVG